MGLFRRLECRAFMLNGSRTSIALEHQFWAAAEAISKAHGVSLQSWAANQLKQAEGGRASMLRVAILEAKIIIKNN
jgi:predicted DNA-binding ribbon-helix-helix protein